MGFSNILVFMAGAMIFLHLQAITVVVSMSSAMPWAILPITSALAGAIITTSACFASDTCSTLNSKFRSKVSTRHLLPVSVSNVKRAGKIRRLVRRDAPGHTQKDGLPFQHKLPPFFFALSCLIRVYYRAENAKKQ